jgi:hypothetical protein
LVYFASCDEETTIDKKWSIFVQMYIMEGWKWFPILSTLQQVVEGSHANNLTKVIILFKNLFNGILEPNLALKLVCFGMDGVTTFQGSKIGVIMQLKEKHAPFLLSVYYLMHRTNLIVYMLL